MSVFTITSENLHTVARDTIVAGRKLARNYSALAVFYSLDSTSESAVITDAARAVVLAAYPDTDPARLGGKNKNDDQRWLDARTVRAGLVRAIKDNDESEPTPAATPDWLRLAIQAAENAVNKGEIDPNTVAEAVTFHMSGLLTVDAA